MTSNDTNQRKDETMDAKVRAMLLEWLASYGGDVEKTARWMSRNFSKFSLPFCRAQLREALNQA